jgi:hypothetical protein
VVRVLIKLIVWLFVLRTVDMYELLVVVLMQMQLIVWLLILKVVDMHESIVTGAH